jgi:hypothetical protein
MLYQIPASPEDDERDEYIEEEVYENDFTFRAVFVGLLVG